MDEGIRSAQRKLERGARDLVYGSWLFFPLRSAYQCLFSREKLALRRKMRDFYAAFVSRGDLVFDVGAQIGTYTQVFSGLGARVVAVEPDPRCSRYLRRLSRTRQVYFENCAAGDFLGRTIFHLSEVPALSTLSDDWCQATQRSPLHRDTKWLGTLEVEVITLDRLAARFGVPSFVKIDVEGYDDRVLCGMSFRPRMLSFEFNQLAPRVATRCLKAPVLANGYSFNFVRGMEMRLARESWLRIDELHELLETLAGEEEYGDVLARRTDQTAEEIARPIVS